MKKKILCALVCVAVFCQFVPRVSAQNSVSALSCVLIDADTKAVLFEKNANTKLAMASTTKIMTALLALESEKTDEPFTVDSNAIRVEGTSMGLCEGDKVSLKSLAIGMLLLSGNDAANAAAVKISGSIKDFCNKMNERAKEIGMKNTNFSTPSGLDSENHYSTAYDMALLGAEAIKNEQFLEICSKKKMSVSYKEPLKTFTFYNHNRLLSSVEGCIGIKTGFTKKAGRCLVSAVRKNGRTLVCVTLKAPNDWLDHKNLYDYGFSLYKKAEINLSEGLDLPIVNSYNDSIRLAARKTPEIYVKSGEKIKVRSYTSPFEYAPIYKGDIVGSVAVEIEGSEVFKTELVALESAHLRKMNEEKSYTLFERFFMWIKGLFR